MSRKRLLSALIGVLMLSLAACGSAGGGAEAPEDPTASDAVADADDGDAPTSGGVVGMCPQEDPDCIDTPELAEDDPVPMDETGVEQARRDAQAYLGATQDQLPEAVRIGRIDDEEMMLTEDYQIGRITVELDDLEGDGNPIVTKATVELPDGPETFELER